MIPRLSPPIRPIGPVISGSRPSPGQLRGEYMGRQSKFDIRAAKRWGGLDLFGVPLPLLWLEQGCVPNLLQPYVCAAQPITNLWP
jgi:hypothetical protein